jgi:hypothetical protein
MAVRATFLILAGAGLLSAAPAPAGRGLVARSQAREFRCENDDDRAGVPALDLYTR